MTMNNYFVFSNVSAAISAWDNCVNFAGKNKHIQPAYESF